MIDVILSTIENEEQRNELAEFYSKHKSRLYSIALSKLHNEEEAEDAVQEIFSRIADKPEKFFDIPPENRLAYADVIVRNIAVDMFNSKNKLKVEQLDDDLPEDSAVSLENRLFGRISRDGILRFVDELPILQREVLMLHCFFGMSIDDTAQRLNISLAAAKKRLMLARKAIRDFIDERSGRYE
ncbi:MAG: RNA polymerase sigma factor [Oscillospiraceae bacterium]|nr:RNA polymerase sigma factor [Oscillospiraceae bacterium]